MKEIYSKVLDDLLKKVRAKGLPEDEGEAPTNMIELQQAAAMEEKKTPQDKAMEAMPDDMKQQMAADNLKGEEMAREGDESEDYDPSCEMCSELGMKCPECADKETQDMEMPEEPDEIKASMMDLFKPSKNSDKKSAFGGAMSITAVQKKPFGKR